MTRKGQEKEQIAALVIARSLRRSNLNDRKEERIAAAEASQ